MLRPSGGSVRAGEDTTLGRVKELILAALADEWVIEGRPPWSWSC